MNKRRLLKLADLLEADAKNKKGITFDLSTVAAPTEGYAFVGETVEINCGTTACAMGLAAISGAFKRAGLSYTVNKCGELFTTMHGRKQYFDRAAMKLFDISEEVADWFFTPYAYPAHQRTGAVGERAACEAHSRLCRRQGRAPSGRRLTPTLSLTLR